MNKKTFKNYIYRIRANDATLTTVSYENYGMSHPEFKALAQALKFNTRIRVLNLNNSDIHDQDAINLSKGLRFNNSLLRVNLGSKYISSKGIEALSMAFKAKNTLISLDLGGNKIGIRGAKAVAELISSGASLDMLDLCGCDLDDEGIAYIMNALSSNTTVKSLNLSSNLIHSAGFNEIARMLNNNSALLELYIRNNIYMNTIGNLIRSLKNNHTLILLDINYNRIDKYLAREFRKYIEKNNTLLLVKMSFDVEECFEMNQINTIMRNKLLDYFDDLNSLYTSFSMNVDDSSLLNSSTLDDILNKAHVVSEVLQKNGINSVKYFISKFYKLMSMNALVKNDLAAAVNWMFKIEEFEHETLNIEMADAILCHNFEDSPTIDKYKVRVLVIVLLRNINTIFANRLILNMLYLLRGGKGLLQDFESTLAEFLDVDEVITLEVIKFKITNDMLLELTGKRIIIYENIALSPDKTIILSVANNKLVDENNNEVNLNKIEVDFEEHKFKLISEVKNHFDNARRHESDSFEDSNESDTWNSIDEEQTTIVSDFLNRLDLDNHLKTDFQSHWTAFGKAPVDNNLIPNINKFISSLEIRNTYPVFLYSVALDKDSKIYHSLRNLITYAGKLQGLQDSGVDNSSLNHKLKSLRKFASFIFSQDEIRAESINQAYQNFEQADRNRSYFCLYRVRTFFMRKTYTDNTGKLRAIKSTTGELVYDFMQTVKNNEEVHYAKKHR